MSIKTNDILARLRAGISTLRPTQTLLDDGFECGAVSNEDFNWLFWILCNSALGNVHAWNQNNADAGGYVHPAVVLGSDGLLYVTIPGQDFTNDPTVSVGVDWDLYDTSALPLNYRSGYRLEYASTTTLTINAGEARSYGNTANIKRSSSITKSIASAWAEGDTLGGLPSALTLAASTWYRVFVISKADGTVDAGFDTSATAATLLADAAGDGYVYYRRVGWMRTNGSSQVTNFYHDPDDLSLFHWLTSVNDLNTITLPTASRTLVALTAPPNSNARITIEARGGASRYALVSSATLTDVAVTETNCNIATNSAGDTPTNDVELKLNSSSQVGYRSDAAGGYNAFNLITRGWRDYGITQ